MKDQELIAILSLLFEELPNSPELDEIKSEVQTDKRTGRKDFETSPPRWVAHREYALAFCRTILRNYSVGVPPIELVATKDFSQLVNVISDHSVQLQPSSANFEMAFRNHWEFMEVLPLLEKQSAQGNSILEKEFFISLKADHFNPPKRPKGRAVSNARRNILTVRMMRALQTLGWSVWSKETAYKTTAADIVVEAMEQELNIHISTGGVSRIWKQYIAHRKKGLAYFGTSLKNRKKARPICVPTLNKPASDTVDPVSIKNRRSPDARNLSLRHADCEAL